MYKSIFYQNLFHLKYFIDLNLKYFLRTPNCSVTNGPCGPIHFTCVLCSPSLTNLTFYHFSTRLVFVYRNVFAKTTQRHCSIYITIDNQNEILSPFLLPYVWSTCWKTAGINMYSIVTRATQYFDKIQKNSNSEQQFDCFNESTFQLNCGRNVDSLKQSKCCSELLFFCILLKYAFI